VLGGVVLAASALAAPSQAAADPGFGKAQALLLMVDPRSAQLSFGVRFGASVADHRNTVARAQAQSTDYGLIGGSLTGAGCTGGAPPLRRDQLPQPYRADSREPKDATTKTLQEGPITESVRAEARPFAAATSRLAEVDLPGLLTIEGAANTTSSGVDDQGVAEVEATVDVGAISLLGGIVRVNGLHWSAVNRADGKPTGSFTIAGATIGGAPIPTQDASATISAINALLSNLGLVITPPVSHLEGDTIFVDPLKVGVAPNAVRDQLTGALIEALQPAREQLFQALIDASCNSGAIITVVDLLLGSVTGGGSFTAVLGGAQAQRSAAESAVRLGGGPAPALGGGGDGGGGTDGAAFVPLPDDAGSTDTLVSSPPGSAAPARRTASTTTTDRDHALAVALGSIVLGGLLLEADRRKMRQAGVAVVADP
jgi:hypothetical protein